MHRMHIYNAFRKKLNDFFTLPLKRHILPLSIFRVLIASFALLQAFLWYPDWLAFFGKDAWIQWEISRALIPGLTIHIEQVYNWFSFTNLSEDQFVMVFFWVYVCSAFGLLLGFYTRFWAILTWFCHYIIMFTIEAYVYGVDIFLQISLFYLMIMPVSRIFSLDAKFKRVNNQASWTVTLSLRVLQIHMCLVYLSAGYEKMLSADWWNGNALWRSLVQPDFREFNLEWLANYPWIAIALSCFTMFIETFYCIAMWIPRLRVFWLAGIIFLHLGIGLFLGLWLFGLIMIFLSVSAFGSDVLHDIRHWYITRKLQRAGAPRFRNIDTSHPITMG